MKNVVVMLVVACALLAAAPAMAGWGVQRSCLLSGGPGLRVSGAGAGGRLLSAAYARCGPRWRRSSAGARLRAAGRRDDRPARPRSRRGVVMWDGLLLRAKRWA